MKNCIHYFPATIFLNVILILTFDKRFLCGREWYQYVLVGFFIINRLPCSNTIFTGSIDRLAFFPLASACLKTKSLGWPSESEAIGWPKTRSFSSSRCSPMWSLPSLYLVYENNVKMLWQASSLNNHLQKWNKWAVISYH